MNTVGYYTEVDNQMVRFSYSNLSSNLKCYTCKHCKITNKNITISDCYNVNFSLRCFLDNGMFDFDCEDYVENPDGDIRDIVIKEYL